MKCPHCGKLITTSEIAKHMRSKVKNNARPREVAQKAAKARWEKYFKNKKNEL